MKKTLALVIVMLMMLSVFAGCGDKESSSDAQTTQTVQTAVPEAAGDAAVPVEAQASGDVTWDMYLAYLDNTFGADSPDPASMHSMIYAMTSWADIQAAIDSATAPWDKMFDASSHNASTWDEFVAAGGVGRDNSDTEDASNGLPSDASGEASKEMPTGEKTEGMPAGEVTAAPAA